MDSLNLYFFFEEFSNLRNSGTKLLFYFDMFADPGWKLINYAGTAISEVGINLVNHYYIMKASLI